MRKLLPFILILAISCNDTKEAEAERDLERLGDTIKKGYKETKEDVKEAYHDLKEDSTIEKIENRLDTLID